METPVYQIRNLTKIYRRSTHKANDGLTFDIFEGEIFGLLGPNGAGKSTMVNQAAGLVRPTSGSVRLLGLDLVKHPELATEYVALQAQQSLSALHGLYPDEAIYYTGRLRGLAAAAASAETKQLVEDLNLERALKTRLDRLSGGQRRLVSLACTFVGTRPVQIFDEPTNDLDPVMRRWVWDKLLDLRSRGVTVILVTHNVVEAERVIERVGIINLGRLVALGTPRELKAKVEQRVRLELVFKSPPDGQAPFLERLGEARALTPLHWTILCRKDVAREAIDGLLGEIGLERLDDFRILTPSLEDVYLQLGGATKLG
jgi:ABC-2 type transport system ATP-binding protein